MRIQNDEEIIEDDDEDKGERKCGQHTFTECPICEDLSYVRCGMNGFSFCINQHKSSDGTERQPASLGTNMVGKPWRFTPAGRKEK